MLTIKRVVYLAAEAGNYNMRKAGRSLPWNTEDWRIAGEVTRRLIPLIDGNEDVERDEGSALG